MVPWLRRLMRTNAWIGLPLSAVYLVFQVYRRYRKRALTVVALCLVIAWPYLLRLSRMHLSTPARDYTLTDLGALSGGNGESWAFGINDSGQVVGGSDAHSGEPHAFLWKDGRMTDLGAGAGVASSAAHISNAGLIAGSFFDAKQVCHAAVWCDGRMIVPTIPAQESRGSGVNDAGQLVGSMGSGHDFNDIAFLSQQGDTARIGDFIARDIDSNGIAVGFTATPQSSTAVVSHNGRAYHLPGSDQGESAAVAINSLGQIAGNSGGSDGQAALWDRGKLHLLGRLGNGDATALALNDRGQVVGTSEIARREHHAFLWQQGRMCDLNDLLPSGSRWLLTAANGINARGQIVGEGRIAGRRHAFLLTPQAP